GRPWRSVTMVLMRTFSGASLAETRTPAIRRTAGTKRRVTGNPVRSITRLPDFKRRIGQSPDYPITRSLKGQLVAVAVVAAQQVVGVLGVGHTHVSAVVVDLRPGAERDHAEEHDFDQPRGVVERR